MVASEGKKENLLATSWYLIPGKKRAVEEATVAVAMVANAWVLLGEGTKCRKRNLCELGYNGAVWSRVGQYWMCIKSFLKKKYRMRLGENVYWQY